MRSKDFRSVVATSLRHALPEPVMTRTVRLLLSTLLGFVAASAAFEVLETFNGVPLSVLIGGPIGGGLGLGYGAARMLRKRADERLMWDSGR
jgi:hypothetical protein